jgi:hypothetical protein
MDLHRQSHVLLFTDSATADDPFCGMIETFSARFRGQLLFVEIGPDEIQLASTFGYKGTMRPQVRFQYFYFCVSKVFPACFLPPVVQMPISFIWALFVDVFYAYTLLPAPHRHSSLPPPPFLYKISTAGCCKHDGA